MRILVGLTMSALMAVAAMFAFSARETPPLASSRLPVEKMHFNTVAFSKAGLVVGGELGHLLYSNNGGKTWTPATVSTARQALVTQVVFAPDGLTGLALAHEGWILRTTDGGMSWTEVAFDEQNGEPMMSAAYLGNQAWLVVGAFGRALQSLDGGQNWQPYVLPAAVEDKHLNRIVGSPDRQHWLIVGERGLLIRSDDGGSTWVVVPEFYNGSFYNAVALPSKGWLVYGMRGNAFTSRDDGAWIKSELSVPASFFGHAQLPDGRILLVGQGGLVATSTDGGRRFGIGRLPVRGTLTDIALNDQAVGWVTSDAGLQPYPPTTYNQKKPAGDKP